MASAGYDAAMNLTDSNGDDRGRIGVLFVCMGNICRSPLAEGVFLHLLRERGIEARFEVESAGTGGWHVGNPPDRRSRAVAAKHGIELPSLARQIEPPADWERFDWVIVMDHENLSHVLGEGAPRERTRLLRSFDASLGMTHNEMVRTQSGEVPDPYYGGDDGFDRVYAMVRRACEGLVEELAR